MLRALWGSPEIRSTMDIEMLGITSIEESEVIKQIQDILNSRMKNLPCF